MFFRDEQFLWINLQIQVEMIQDQLHLVYHSQLDDILVDFDQLMVMMVEQFQLKNFNNKF